MTIQKTQAERKGGIPLDELLAAHAAGDDRLGRLGAKYGATFAKRPKC